MNKPELTTTLSSQHYTDDKLVSRDYKFKKSLHHSNKQFLKHFENLSIEN